MPGDAITTTPSPMMHRPRGGRSTAGSGPRGGFPGAGRGAHHGGRGGGRGGALITVRINAQAMTDGGPTRDSSDRRRPADHHEHDPLGVFGDVAGEGGDGSDGRVMTAYGEVVTIKESFGFVRCHGKWSGPQLFFHATEVMEGGIHDLRVGDDVKFTVREGGGREGKPNAIGLSRVTEEDRVPTVLARGVQGRVVRALRGQTTKAMAYGGRIAFTLPEGAAGGDGCHVADGRPAMNDAAAAAADDDDAKAADPPPPPSRPGGGPVAATNPNDPRPDEATVDFLGVHLADRCPRLKTQDAVTFDVVADRFTGKRRIANVMRTAQVGQKGAGSATEGAAEVSGGGSSASAADGRELGRIHKLTRQGYGFVSVLTARPFTRGLGPVKGEAPLFFHYSTLGTGTREEDLETGAAVWFVRKEAAPEDAGSHRRGTATEVALAPEEVARAAEAELEEQARASRTGIGATGSDAERWGKSAGVMAAGNKIRGEVGASDDDGYEFGVVASMRANFGFIKCCERVQDVFFHFTEVAGGEAAVSVGQDVRFRLKSGGDRRVGSDKPVAVSVSAVPKGTAVFETVSPVVRRGVCKQRLVLGGRAERSAAYGGRNGGGALGGNGTVEFVVEDDDEDAGSGGRPVGGRAGGEDGSRGASGKEGGEQGGTGGAGGSDATAPAFVSGEGGTPEGGDAGGSGGEDGDEGPFSEDRSGTSKTTTATLPYTRGGLEDVKTNPRPGDVVTFRVSTDRRTGRRTAVEVNVMRFEGRVAAVIKGSYGFLTTTDDPADEAPTDGVHEGEGDPASAPSEEDKESEETASTTQDVSPLSPSPSPAKPSRAKPTEGSRGKAGKTTRVFFHGSEWKLTRVFFHGSEVENGVTLKVNDEVAYFITMPGAGGSGGGGGRGGDGKEPSARRVVRTKEAPEPQRPTFVNANKDKTSAGRTEEGDGGERPSGTQFTQGSQFTMAKMPDGTRGFTMGRGRGLAEAAKAAISKLKLTAAPFTPPTPTLGAPAAAGAADDPPSMTDVVLNPDAAEDAEGA